MAGKGGCVASRGGSAQVEPGPGICGFKRSPCGHLCRPSWRGVVPWLSSHQVQLKPSSWRTAWADVLFRLRAVWRTRDSLCSND